MSSGQLAYLSFLLRLWRAPGGDKQLWRASLETTLTGERKGFADPEALCAFLHSQMGGHALPSGDPGECATVTEGPQEDYDETEAASDGDV